MLQSIKLWIVGYIGFFAAIIFSVSYYCSYGFVPNGTRKYYLNRSQPPMLIPMMSSYMEKSGDLTYLKDSINTLEKVWT